jgi:hypothetical protein
MAVEHASDANVLVRGFRNAYSAVSPNGRWMAYNSGVSGRAEVYVERYPELGDRQQISTGGGRMPLWSRDGRELFFATPDNRQILTVPVQAGTTLIAGRPQVLFEFALFVTGAKRAPGGVMSNPATTSSEIACRRDTPADCKPAAASAPCHGQVCLKHGIDNHDRRRSSDRTTS